MMRNFEQHNYRCPRCKGENIIEYVDSIECLTCKMEFEKEDLEKFEEDSILSIEEKLDIFDMIPQIIKLREEIEESKKKEECEKREG